jgi:class 3 adenylate cyclase
MRRSLAKFSESEASNHTPSLADFITTTSELRFSVHTRVGRRLSAIVAADVAGYSRLIHDDEEATHAKLRALLAEIVEPAISEHGGRIEKNTGDVFAGRVAVALGGGLVWAASS